MGGILISIYLGKLEDRVQGSFDAVWKAHCGSDNAMFDIITSCRFIGCYDTLRTEHSDTKRLLHPPYQGDISD